MNPSTNANITLFLANTHRMMGRSFVWHNQPIKYLAAYLYTSKNKMIDIDEIKSYHDMLTSNTSIFSMFRNNNALILAVLLSLVTNRRSLLEKTIRVYEMMKLHKFPASDYLVLGAYRIASTNDVHECSQTITRAKSFYDGMKKKHRFLSGSHYIIFAVLLGQSDIEVQVGLNQIEQLYQSMRANFRSMNAVYMAAQILCLTKSRDNINSDIMNLYGTFKQQKLPFQQNIMLPMLGILSLLSENPDQMVSNIKSIFDYLRKQKGFGKFHITGSELLLFSSAIYTMTNLDEKGNDILTSLLSTVMTNIIIAQETANSVVVTNMTHTS